MKRIYKYPLEAMPVQTVEIPEGARPLRIAYQRGQACLWALVDPDRDMIQVQVLCLGTGWDVDYPEENLTYLDTIFDQIGYVWHWFLIKTDSDV